MSNPYKPDPSEADPYGADPSETGPFFVRLPGRGLLHLEGPARYDFLQKLISNDIARLETKSILYACLLSPQGKFLHDFFVLEGNGFLLIDCEGGARAKDLYERLNTYRLRSDVRISVEETNDVYAVFGSGKGKSESEGQSDGQGLADPRHPDLGRRSFEKPPGLEEKPFAQWDRRRIELGVPDGSRDMEVGRSTLLECNIDKLGGIDWDKGCYTGQELTARMHHRGLCKKHLYPVRTIGPAPQPFSDIHLNGALVGNMRSSCGEIGLALLKDEAIKDMTNEHSPIRLLGQ